MPDEVTVLRRFLTYTEKSLKKPEPTPAGSRCCNASAYSLTSLATSMVEPPEVLLMVRLMDGLPIKRPSVTDSANRSSLPAISPRRSTPPSWLLRMGIFAIACCCGAVPMPRRRISPSLVRSDPPGRSRRLLRNARATCSRET